MAFPGQMLKDISQPGQAGISQCGGPMGHTARPYAAGRPFKNAMSPERFERRWSLAVSNSSPIRPRRRSQVRKVYLSLEVTVTFGLADRWVIAWADIARQNCIYALTFPAWSVESKYLNSTVCAYHILWRFNP